MSDIGPWQQEYQLAQRPLLFRWHPILWHPIIVPACCSTPHRLAKTCHGPLYVSAPWAIVLHLAVVNGRKSMGTTLHKIENNCRYACICNTCRRLDWTGSSMMTLCHLSLGHRSISTPGGPWKCPKMWPKCELFSHLLSSVISFVILQGFHFCQVIHQCYTSVCGTRKTLQRYSSSVGSNAMYRARTGIKSMGGGLFSKRM